MSCFRGTQAGRVGGGGGGRWTIVILLLTGFFVLRRAVFFFFVWRGLHVNKKKHYSRFAGGIIQRIYVHVPGIPGTFVFFYVMHVYTLDSLYKKNKKMEDAESSQKVRRKFAKLFFLLLVRLFVVFAPRTARCVVSGFKCIPMFFAPLLIRANNYFVVMVVVRGRRVRNGAATTYTGI